MSVYLFVYQPLCLSACLSVCPSVCVCMCLCVCLFIFLCLCLHLCLCIVRLSKSVTEIMLLFSTFLGTWTCTWNRPKVSARVLSGIQSIFTWPVSDTHTHTHARTQTYIYTPIITSRYFLWSPLSKLSMLYTYIHRHVHTQTHACTNQHLYTHTHNYTYTHTYMHVPGLSTTSILIICLFSDIYIDICVCVYVVFIIYDCE